MGGLVMSNSDFLLAFVSSKVSPVKSNPGSYRYSRKIYDIRDLPPSLANDLIMESEAKGVSLDIPASVKRFPQLVDAILEQQHGKSDYRTVDVANLNPRDPGHPDYIYTYLHPCNMVGVEDSRKSMRFWDERRNEITPYTHHNVDTALRLRFPKDQVNEWWTKRTIASVHACYRPKSKKVLIREGNGEEKRFLNFYLQPEWKAYAHEVDAVVPEMYHEFILHLFPDRPVRNYVVSWMYHSLHTRAQTYLYLNGGQGTGKNILVELLRALHGPSNYATLREVNPKFNHRLKNATLVFYDELRRGRDPGTKEALKANINGEIEVEGKFRDAEQIELHASFVIASNALDALTLEPIDRRFSVPEITETNLLAAKGQDWIDDLMDEIRDLKSVARFGKWLLEVFEPSYTEMDVWQHSRFEEIVIATARNGYRFTLDRILRKEEKAYSYDEEKEEYERIASKREKAYYPTKSDWLHFFKHLKKDATHVIEHLDGDACTMVPREEFRPDGRATVQNLHRLRI